MARDGESAGGRPLAERLTPGGVALGASLVLAVLVGVLVDRTVWVTGDRDLLTTTRDSLQVATGALFFGAGLLHLSVWRVDRDETRGRIGAALVVVGFVAPWITGFGRLIHTDERAAALSPVTSAVVALLALALGSSGVRGFRRVPSHPGVAVWTLALLLPVLLVGPFFLVPGASVIADPAPAPHLALELMVAALWLSAAVLAGRHVRRTGSTIPGIGAAVLAAMAAVWVLRAAAVLDVQPWSVAAAVLLAATGLVVLSRAAVDFTESAEAGTERTTAAEEALATVAEAFSALDAERRTVTHDARNVILALSAASRTLAEHGDELDAEVRTRLSRAIAEEVTHLGRLMSPAPVADAVTFDPCTVVRTVAELERLHGLDAALTLEPCAATGRPEDTARVIRNLLVNARLHAPGSRVRVEVRDAGSAVRILVEDDGPGIPEGLRREVFGRGVRGVDGGSGLGLHVSRALMRQQGGTLELVESARGTRFVVTLPPATSAGDEPRVPLPRSARAYA
jgi:signal transduction histidine kinase